MRVPGKLPRLGKGFYGEHAEDRDACFSCNGEEYGACEYFCHQSCMANASKQCECTLKPVLLTFGEVFRFRTGDILEIPDWTENTAKINECYKMESSDETVVRSRDSGKH